VRVSPGAGLRETAEVRQRIRFCATPAGRVAYSIMGDGPVVLCDTGWVSHLEKMLEIASVGGFFGALAGRFRVVRYDKAGTGLSDRVGVDLSFDAQVASLVALADQVGADRPHLFGASQGGQVSAAFAARHPERVASLVLYGSCIRGSDLAPEDVRASLVSLVRAHWGLGSKALAGVFVPELERDNLRDWAQLQRSASAAIAAELLEEYYRTDIAALLPTITAPTLVLHREQDRATAFRLGREVASLIPNATFVPLQGSTHLFWMGNWKAVVDAIVEFLPEQASPTAPGLSRREREVAALVAKGLTNHEIAKQLYIAPRTVDTHLENIREKLGFRSRAQIAVWSAAQPTGEGGATT
jgi:pimeloyl-ACP methyl ester carboxylesterase